MPQGKVNWFDPQKGFGFINVDGGGEVFVRQRDFVRRSIRNVLCGQRLSFDIDDDPKGQKAVNVVLVDEFGEEVPEVQHPKSGTRLKGTLLWFNAEMSFGYISVDGHERELYVHRSQIQALLPIKKGERLVFTVERNKEGRAYADKVRRLP